MRFLELVVLRGVLWVGLPLLLVVLAVGPNRFWRGVKRGWNWLWQKRFEPEQILAQVVSQHQEHVAALGKAVEQAETAESAIVRNIRQSEENIAALEKESQDLAGRTDDLGTRAALYKLNLERTAMANFREQLAGQRELIAEARRRLYLVELQLRQYEVGRGILLSQLAEAKTAEQQYAIANEFDPFSAVANWRKAEGMVEEQTLNARAAEKVHIDTADLTADKPAEVRPEDLDAQLAALKAQMKHGQATDKEDRRDRRRQIEN